MIAALGIDTEKHGIVCLRDVAQALHEDLPANVDRFTAAWHRHLKPGDTVVAFDLLTLDDPPPLACHSVSEAVYGGLIGLQQVGTDEPAYVPAGTLVAQIDDPVELDGTHASFLAQTHRCPEMIVTTVAPPTYAYRPRS